MALFGRTAARSEAGRESRALTFMTPPIGAYTQALADQAGGDVDSAMRVASVWKCVDLISSMLSIMDPVGYRGPDIGVGAANRIANQPEILEQPSASADIMDWMYQAQISILLRGNVYGEIVGRGAFGRPTQIELQHPDRVKVVEERDGTVVYKYGQKEIDPHDVWHGRAYWLPGVQAGLSPIKYHQRTLKTWASAQRFGNNWFDDGAHPSAILTNDNIKTVGQPEADTIKKRFLDAVHGTREPVVLTGGWQYKQIQINPDESQFLDTMKFTGGQVCGIYRVPPELVAESSEGSSITYANVEARGQDFLTFTMMRWVRRMERWLNDLTPPGGYVKLNLENLLRTDALTRWRIHHMQVGSRILAGSEIRTMEDIAPATPEQQAEIDRLVTPVAPPIASPGTGD